MTSGKLAGSLLEFSARALLLVVCFARYANAQTLESASWQSSPPNVASVAWTPMQVGAFLDSIAPSPISSNVGTYRFSDLANDGNLELIAAVDYSGRGFFNRIVIVHKTSVGFGVQQIEATSVISLANSIADINKDGKQELLVPTSLTGYTTSSFPVDAWTAVYSWSQDVLVDSTRSFEAYEKSLLPNLQSTATSLNVKSPGSIAAVVAEALLDKTSRISGVDATAGLSDAKDWAFSATREVRIVAAATLADIDTPDAKNLLESLLKDVDHTVVVYANLAVTNTQSANALPISIEILSHDHEKVINLSGQEPIRVRIKKAKELDRFDEIEVKSITFGETGIENSRIDCRREDEWHHDHFPDHHERSIECEFSPSAAGFSVGDSVAILKAKLRSGESVQGMAGIIVVEKN